MPGTQKCSTAANPILMAGDFPPPAAAKSLAQRLTECAAAKEPNCYTKINKPMRGGLPTNCIYGWVMGKGHPASNSYPPAYDKLLNALDQCAYFHDRGAWQYNRNTTVCESWTMCSNSMGLMRCLDRDKPKNETEAAAKSCFSQILRRRCQRACRPCIPTGVPNIRPINAASYGCPPNRSVNCAAQ
jgi:hypothetical protein